MRSAIISDFPMRTCRTSGLAIIFSVWASPALAGHAGESGGGLLPHELWLGLVVLAGLLLCALMALGWVIARLRRLDRRLRDLEVGRKR